MNKKGFTLTEMLAVVVILSIITLIAVPSVVTVKKSINERDYNSKKELITNAAELYVQDGNSGIETDASKCGETLNADEKCVSIQDLLKYKYLKADYEKDGIYYIYNPKYGEEGEPEYLSSGYVLVRKNENGVVGIYGGKSIVSNATDFVEYVCSKMKIYGGNEGTRVYVSKDENGEYCDCDHVTSSGNKCLIVGKNNENYVRFPNGTTTDVMWRIMGVYYEDGKKVVKLVTDDNIVIEE